MHKRVVNYAYVIAQILPNLSTLRALGLYYETYLQNRFCLIGLYSNFFMLNKSNLGSFNQNRLHLWCAYEYIELSN